MSWSRVSGSRRSGPHDPDRSWIRARPWSSRARVGRCSPGLIDAHAHYTFDPTEGSLQAIARRSDADILDAAAGHAGRALRAGITTARGAGSIRNLECRLRDAIAAGGVAGPRIVAAGTAVGRHRRSRVGVRAGGRRTRCPGRGHAGGRRRRRRRREGRGLGGRDAHDDGPRPGRHGPRRARADVEELRAIVTTAAELGRRVMCHAQDSESVRRSAAAGVTSSSMPGSPTRRRSRPWRPRAAGSSRRSSSPTSTGPCRA